MKSFFAKRIARDELSTLSRWEDDAGNLLCFCVEPSATRTPHPGIPAYTYVLKLRAAGKKHAAYLDKYGPDFHKGMIEITGVPGREAILFHVGNTIADSEGCSLCGEKAIDPLQSLSRHWEVSRSRVAYEKVYPILRDAILAGPVVLNIIPIGAVS